MIVLNNTIGDNLFSSREQKSPQAPSEIDYTTTFASVFIRAKLKRIKALCFSATIQKVRVFSAQDAHDKFYRHDRRDWHTNSMPLPDVLDPIECQC